MSGYNGWTNYETWRINIEVLEGMTLEDFGFDVEDVNGEDVAEWQVAKTIESYVEEIVTDGVSGGLALDLVNDFLNRVNWDEIAEHIIADARAEV